MTTGEEVASSRGGFSTTDGPRRWWRFQVAWFEITHLRPATLELPCFGVWVSGFRVICRPSSAIKVSGSRD